MNTPIFSTELDPAEQRRRKAALEKTSKLVRRLGFRTVAGKPGRFYHPDIDQDVVFDWSNLEGQPWNVDDFICAIYFRGLKEGQEHQCSKLREALGL